MAKILFNNEWYEELSPTAFYEADYEKIIGDKGSLIFENYYLIPFKTRIYTEDDIVRPDLALIDKEYRDWWVVEVEMSYHSLDDHVLPQVTKLARGLYGEEQANFLCSKEQLLDHDKMVDMLKGKHPQILVIVNKLMPEWVRVLKRFNTTVCVIEVFRSEKNQHVFRVNGEYPTITSDYISDCYHDPFIPRFLVVDSPASLLVPPGHKVDIYYENCRTEWERIDGKDKVWLSPISLNPLPKKKRFTILRNDDGSLIFKEK